MTSDIQDAVRDFLEATEDFPDSEWAEMFLDVKVMRQLCEEHIRLQARHADLLSVVVQPWIRDGDGAKLFKVNLAWWETAKTREEAEALVEEAVARVKRKGGQP